MTDFWIFVGALAVAYLVPGPDMVLILHISARQGRAQAIAVAIGLAVARAIHVLLAAIGLAALFRTAPWAFEIVRFAGAAYLVWLGVGILRSRLPTPEGPGCLMRPADYLWPQAMLRGLLTNLLNPKALLFCSVLLPQFIRPENGSMSGQFAFLGAILVTTGLAFDLVYACAGAALSRWATRHAIVQTLQRWTFATLLISFGLRLALAQRAL